MADERVIVSRNKLEAIVAALKEKTGKEDGYTLSEIPDAILNIGNNGGSGYALSDVNGVLTKDENKVIITWTDPTDLLDHIGNTIAEWEGTILVKKENEIPIDINDGEQIVVNTIRDQYALSGFIDEDIDLTKSYFYRFFPYTKNNVYLLSTIKPCLPDTSWSTASDETIAMLINMADMGYIDLYNDLGWRIGDERVVHLNSNEGYSGWSVSEQNVTFVLMNKGGYEFVNPPSSKQTQCHFVVGMKEVLYNGLPMGWQDNTQIFWWGNTKCRKWCNDIFITSLPLSLQPIFKKVKIKSGKTNTIVDITEDLFFISAQKEILGVKGNSFQVEADSLPQWEYYKIAENRKKTMYSSTNKWAYYNRSIYEPRYPNGHEFCTINKDGEANTTDWGDTSTYTISVAGCI